MTRLRRMKETSKSAKIIGPCTGTHKRSVNLKKKKRQKYTAHLQTPTRYVMKVCCCAIVKKRQP